MKTVRWGKRFRDLISNYSGKIFEYWMLSKQKLVSSGLFSFRITLFLWPRRNLTKTKCRWQIFVFFTKNCKNSKNSETTSIKSPINLSANCLPFVEAIRLFFLTRILNSVYVIQTLKFRMTHRVWQDFLIFTG